jgi:hypothetical protein
LHKKDITKLKDEGTTSVAGNKSGLDATFSATTARGAPYPLAHACGRQTAGEQHGKGLNLAATREETCKQ